MKKFWKEDVLENIFSELNDELKHKKISIPREREEEGRKKTQKLFSEAAKWEEREAKRVVEVLHLLFNVFWEEKKKEREKAEILFSLLEKRRIPKWEAIFVAKVLFDHLLPAEKPGRLIEYYNLYVPIYRRKAVDSIARYIISELMKLKRVQVVEDYKVVLKKGISSIIIDYNWGIIDGNEGTSVNRCSWAQRSGEKHVHKNAN